ncbi:MAG: hypothetical protein AAGA85_07275, partial [Bacteroidota bacterium]
PPHPQTLHPSLQPQDSHEQPCNPRGTKSTADNAKRLVLDRIAFPTQSVAAMGPLSQMPLTRVSKRG